MMVWIGRIVMPAGAIYCAWTAIHFTFTRFPDLHVQSHRIPLGIFFFIYLISTVAMSVSFWRMKP